MAYGVKVVGNPSNRQIDLDHLRTRVREKPRTKAGQVRQAWPEIRDLISAGHSLKDIWAWLNESGVSIGYARLSHYVGQLRKQDKTGVSPAQRFDPGAVARVGQARPARESSLSVEGNDALVPHPADDPLVNVRERQDKRAGFNYNSEPDLRKLI